MGFWIFLLALQLQAAQGMEEVLVNCGDPKQLKYFQQLASEAKFMPPKAAWDDCQENGHAYQFNCRVHPEYGYVCPKAKRMVESSAAPLKAREIMVSSSVPKKVIPIAAPPKPAPRTAPPPELEKPQPGFFESLWTKFKSFFE